MNDRPHLRGVTLLELLCALAVAATLLAIGVPSFGQLIARNQLAVTSNQLAAALMSARTLAVMRNVSVTFCAGNASVGCHGDWTRQEWITFVDRNRNGRLDADDQLQLTDRLLRAKSVLVVGNGPFRKAVVFRPSGIARSRTGALALGRLRICVTDLSGPNANDLVQIGSGRVVLEKHDFEGECPLP